MLKYYDIEQNTEEWLRMRAGKLTSSKLGVVMANYGKAFGDPAKKYAIDIAVEQITGQPISSNFSNSHMARGHEQEPLARRLYEETTFCDVKKGGFFCSDTVGCSPDGLPENGVIEIKSHIPSVHHANVKRAGIDPAYKWQVIGNLMYTGREWIDYISYCHDYPEGKKIFVFRGYPEMFRKEAEQIKSRVSEFMEMVSKTKHDIKTKEYFIN